KTLAHSSIYLGTKRINPIHIQNLACFVPWSVILLISIVQSRYIPSHIKYHQRQYYFNGKYQRVCARFSNCSNKN
ncbi:hypothetical protein GQX74_005062, partial [Glossina fuscipes]